MITLTDIATVQRHAAEARADADALDAANCHHLATVRRRDAAALERMAVEMFLPMGRAA